MEILAVVIPEMTRPTKSQPILGASHDEIIETESEIRSQHHRPAAEAIRQNAEHGRKLHRCKKRFPKNPEPFCRACRVAAEKVQDELRQDRRDQTQREHVERDGDENKNDGGFARFHVRARKSQKCIARDKM